QTFDYIVPIERKGTALVRAELMSSDGRGWSKVLSREAAPATLANKPGAKVLVLDDSVWSGKTIKQTVDMLRQEAPHTRLTTAAFMTHRDAPPDAVDISYFEGLGDDSFKSRREAVVDYLQRQGSLLLDAEHAEVVVS